MALRVFTRWSRLAATALIAVVIAPAPASGFESLQYVTTSLLVGSNQSEAASYGLDVDADGTPDNELGRTLAALSTVIPVDASIARSLAVGDSVILHSLATQSLGGNRAATWQTLLGVPTGNPDLTGGGSFVVDSSEPVAKRLHGRVTNGRFVGGTGRIPLRLGLVPDAAPVQLLLMEGRVDATCTSDRCSGRLGGGISSAQVDSVVVPALAAAMEAVVDGVVLGVEPRHVFPGRAEDPEPVRR